MPESLRSYAIRRSLRDARVFREQGRLEAALRATSRGLAVAPDEPRLLHLHADLLAELGREEEAAEHRARAHALVPPLPPLPDAALPSVQSGRLLVLLLPPPGDDDPHSPRRVERVPQEWPDGTVAPTLRERLALRLPAAQVLLLDPTQLAGGLGSVDAVRSFLEAQGRTRVLSLRVDRAFCGSSVDHGEWAVGWLRVAASARGRDGSRVEELRRVVERPSTCKSEVIARALEDLFAKPLFADLLAGGDAGSDLGESWSRTGIRGVFPGLGLALERQIEAGRRQLAGGNLLAAEEHFLRAVAIDPGDLDASSFLAEVRLALVLSRELSRPPATVARPSKRPGKGPGKGASKSPGKGAGASHEAKANGDSDEASAVRLRSDLREEEIRALRRRLLEARSRRNELLAALAVMEGSAHSPSEDTLAVLRPSEIRDPDALGPRLARAQAETGVEARVLFAPDGAVVARYYFDAAGGAPLLREEDADGDGRPDLWTAYEGSTRREMWQDDTGQGKPNLHVTFGDGGIAVAQVEIDADGNGLVERLFAYEGGQLSGELRDTTGDGRLDRKERFDSDGSLTVREEDLDGDSEYDVRTRYRSGRMISREILNPDLIDSLTFDSLRVDSLD